MDTTWVKENAPCWIEFQENDQNNEYFQKGQIVSINKINLKATVKLKQNQIESQVQMSRLYQRSTQEDILYDDLVDMECLNEAELMDNLKKRYMKDQFQSFIGPTLLIINPYKQIPLIYEDQNIEFYYNKILIENSNPLAYKQTPPHVFAIAAETYRQLFENERKQAIVISGESGSGKTENAKLCMKFLTQISSRYMHSSQNNNKKYKYNSVSSQIEEKILSCNPILEALGNAKTEKNDNSSRFGKYVTLIVDCVSRKIIGAKIINYVLEKSRIITQALDERNFHIFYHFLYGASQQYLAQFGLQKSNQLNQYEYLKKSECFVVPNINEVQNYQKVEEALKILGLNAKQNTIFSLIATVLHLGNIDFDDSTLDNNNTCKLINENIINIISKLLEIDAQQLKMELVSKLKNYAGQDIQSPLTKKDCLNVRDSLAKYIYEKLFQWIVDFLNEKIEVPKDNDNNQKQQNKQLTIGMLDIYGFEVLRKNNFEQFLINYTNEKLHQLYITYVFREEQQIFINENLKQHQFQIDYPDNQQIIDLFEKPQIGLFSMIDESSSIPSTDDNLLNKIKDKHKSSKLILATKFANTPIFSIKHTPREVEYNITGFLVKNKDEMQKSLIQLLSSSKNIDIQQIFTNQQQELDKKSQQLKTQDFRVNKFLCPKVRNEIMDLMNELISCDDHFIRCIKSNPNKQPGQFITVQALTQVRYLGILDSIKVRKLSYPIRREYKIFYKRYGFLMKSHKPYSIIQNDKNTDFCQLTKEVFDNQFKNLTNKDVLFGKTKIFLRNHALKFIEDYFLEKTKEINDAAKIIQLNYQGQKQLKKTRAGFKAIKRLKELWQGYKQKKKYIKMKESARLIQRWIKKKTQKLRLKKIQEQTKIIQIFIKRVISYNFFQQQLQIICYLQKFWRDSLKIRKLRKQRFINNLISVKFFNYKFLNYLFIFQNIKY